MKLADGHYVIERVVENRADFFKYQLFVFTNSTGRGVEQVVGEQRFIATENGTRFEWSYKVRPRNFVTRQIVRHNGKWLASFKPPFPARPREVQRLFLPPRQNA